MCISHCAKSLIKEEKMKKDKDIELLLKSLLDGTISRDDFKILKDWSSENEENRETLRSMVSVELLSRNKNTTVDLDSAIKRFHTYVDKKTYDTEKSSNDKCFTINDVLNSKNKRIRVLRRLWMAAAVFLVLVLPLAGVWLGRNMIHYDYSNVVAEAPSGSQLMLTLPDGSTVRLNSNSRITYSQGYGIADRVVKLEGEGLFTVKHDERLPFKVITHDMIIDDIGTVFNVCNYEDDSKATLMMYEGLVELTVNSRSSDKFKLKKGDNIVLDKHNGMVNRTVVNTKNKVSFDEMFFEDMRIDDIARVLSRNYGVKIAVKADVADIRFYGYFNRRSDSVEKILEAISSTGRVKYRNTGNGYVLY